MRKIIATVLLAVVGLSAVAVRATTLPAPLFKVGVATVNIDPPRPQFLGGFGYADPVGTIHDPLEVRAIAISNGSKVVEFAIVDTQGWFAGYQEGPWGSRDARLEAAEQISALDLPGIEPMTDADIIVSSTHSHAAPTIMGIWGTTDVAYLEQVHAGTVRALVDAVRNMRPADLYAGMADIATVTISALSQTDGYQGWRAEGDTPVLVARDPATHEVIGVYANVPTHADIVEGIGDDDEDGDGTPECPCISADHVGVERTQLDEALGGTSVVAMGTLGRQETIVQVDGLSAAERVGTFVTNEIQRAIATATQITSASIQSAQQYMVLPASNPALLALNVANVPAEALAPGSVSTHCAPGVDRCTIDRSILPPYAVGASFGVWFTAFRIGPVVYATEPGEAFPEVSAGIRRAMGADGGADVRIVGMAQDQLGYYYPPETLPFTGINDSDHHIYNASLVLGEANVQAHALNALALGLPANPLVHETNQYDDVDGSRHAGVQFYPVDGEMVVGSTFRFEAMTSGSALGGASRGLLGTDAGPGAITWDFGDGTVEVAPRITSHVYDEPGSYEVRATVTDPVDGSARTWRYTVRVNPPLLAGVSEAGGMLTATLAGGEGHIIAAHWRWADDMTTHGLKMEDRGMGGTLTVVDGAGNEATVSF